MMIPMGVIVPENVRVSVPSLVRKSVKQRNAGREEVGDQRQHREECASATLRAY
jgi:hypothetical protein